MVAKASSTARPETVDCALVGGARPGDGLLRTTRNILGTEAGVDFLSRRKASAPLPGRTPQGDKWTIHAVLPSRQGPSNLHSLQLIQPIGPNKVKVNNVLHLISLISKPTDMFAEAKSTTLRRVALGPVRSQLLRGGWACR